MKHFLWPKMLAHTTICFALCAQNLSAQSVTLQPSLRISIVREATTQEIALSGKVPPNIQAEIEIAQQGLIWLSKQTYAQDFLVESGYDATSAATVIGLGRALANGTQSGYLGSPQGASLVDTFSYGKSFEDLVQEAMRGLLDEAGIDEAAIGGDGTGSKESDPCGNPNASDLSADQPTRGGDPTASDDFATMMAAGEAFKAGLSSGSTRETAGMIGEWTGKAIGVEIGARATALTSETGIGILGGVALTVFLTESLGVLGRQAGYWAHDTTEAAYNDYLVSSAEENQREADALVNKARSAESEAEADVRNTTAELATAEAEAGEAADAAQAALEKASQTNSQEDKSKAFDALQKQSQADKKVAQLKDQLKEEEKALAEKQKQTAEAEKAQEKAKAEVKAAKKKQAEGTLPGDENYDVIAASPYGRYLKGRILQDKLRILSAFIDKSGGDPRTILTNPLDEKNGRVTSAGEGGTRVSDGLKTPKVNLGRVINPCYQNKLAFAPEDGAGPTVINPDPDGEPQDGPVGPPPGNPLD